jgi:hypothetical protein
MNDLPNIGAGCSQEALFGVTDAICLDDTPDVMHDLHVDPVGQPEVVARVEFRQLAIYDTQVTEPER